MGHQEIYEEHFDNSPILFALKVGDEEILEFGYFTKELFGFEKETQSEEAHSLPIDG